MTRVLIVGSGRVGRAAGLAIVSRGAAEEVVFYDRSPDVARASAEDTAHAAACFNSPTKALWTYEPVDADIVVVTASSPSGRAAKSRLELLEANAKVIEEIAEKVYPAAPKAWYVVVTNPVEAIAALLAKLTGSQRVVATSTFIDSARLRCFLARKLSVEPREVQGFMGGVHGEDLVILWSTVRVRGEKVEPSKELEEEAMRYVVEEPWRILKTIGMTASGAGAMAVSIVEAIASPTVRVEALGPVTSYGCAGMPCYVGAWSVEPALQLLSSDERKSIEERARKIASLVESLES